MVNYLIQRTITVYIGPALCTSAGVRINAIVACSWVVARRTGTIIDISCKYCEIMIAILCYMYIMLNGSKVMLSNFRSSLQWNQLHNCSCSCSRDLNSFRNSDTEHSDIRRCPLKITSTLKHVFRFWWIFHVTVLSGIQVVTSTQGASPPSITGARKHVHLIVAWRSIETRHTSALVNVCWNKLKLT